MIDAYEIGIQLLLQDDVSAGLAVVNQGLAVVDRAIAATNANLVGLIREADAATKAVAAAMTRQVVPAAGQRLVTAVGDINSGVAPSPSHDTESSSTQIATKREERSEPGLDQTANTQASTPAVAPVIAAGAAETERSTELTVSPDPISPVAPATQVVTKSVEPSAAPDVRTATIIVDPPLSPQGTRPTSPVESSAPAQPALRDRILATSPSAGHARGALSVSAPPVAVTASINQFRRSSEASGGQAALRATSPQQETRRRERPVSPGTRVEHNEHETASNRLSDRSDRSPSSAQDRGERTGGNVMLDGRLVGQWLAEHMGREASRPPGGTTFFDPRQTPAWNISGAL